MTEAPAAIVLRQASRLYAGRAALRSVSLTAPPGKILALLGASGSGKSTLLRLIAGLEPVDSGEIRIGDVIVSSPGVTQPPEARRVGMVFQDFALFPHLSVRDNVAFGLRDWTREARAAEAERLLDLVGLAARADAFPHMLSGGEQQRVAIARALAPRPRAMLLDEPFSGLDPSLRGELRDVTLRVLREAGATTVFVTHDADEALYVADQLAILKDGALLQIDVPRTVYEAPTSAAAAAALGPINVARSAARGGRVETPFGPVQAEGFPDGPVEIVARVEALRLCADGPGRTHVRDRRPHGPSDMVMLESGGVIWRALVDPGSTLAPGDETRVALGPRGVHVFPPTGA